MSSIKFILASLNTAEATPIFSHQVNFVYKVIIKTNSGL